MPDAPTPIPRGGAGEQLRQHLLDVMQERWTRRVTTVVAGAGFGKSTLLHQMIRANMAQPQGLDVFMRCRPEHREPDRLTGAILEQLVEQPVGVTPIQRVFDVLRRMAPVDVALVLDDVHTLSESASVAVIDELIDASPANVHLVLLGRELSAVALARLRVVDDILELGERELAFTPLECERLAAHFGRPTDVVDGLGGWPALVRLALAAQRRTAGEFLHEEVLAGLELDERQALAALCLVRPAASDTLAEILDLPVDAEALARRLPLVTIDDTGRLEAHSMWDGYLANMVPAGRLEAVTQRAIGALVTEGRLHEAGDLAVRSGDWDALDRISVELVAATLSVPSVATARAWLAEWPTNLDGSPGRLLLEATVSVAEAQDDIADGLIDRALEAMGDDTPSRLVFAAITVAIMGAFHRRDLDRLIRLGDVARRIDHSGSNPSVLLCVAMVDACRAAADGDPAVAVRHLRGAPLDEGDPAMSRAAYRFLCVNLTLSGHADEAVDVADGPLRRLGHPDDDWVRWISHWQAGDIGQYLRSRGADLPHPAGAPSRAVAEAVVAQKLLTVAQACCGDPIDPAVALRPIVGRAGSRAVGYQALAAAALAVQRHDEETARRELDGFIERWDGVMEAELTLRRFLALGYVLVPGLRDRWDATDFGPSLASARTLARALLDGRSGQPVAPNGLAPERVLVSLPLPWSVELACHLIEQSDPFGRELLDWLGATLGPVVDEELRYLATSKRSASTGAAALISDIRSPPSSTTRVDVLGPLDVSIDGSRSVSADLRRARVRELLTLLVLEPKVMRDRAAGSLWPALDSEGAARNLRVTLSYLRRVLEPDRRRGEASYHLLADGSDLQLHRSHRLATDYWDFSALLDKADRAQLAGDPHQVAGACEAATSLWRGEPCPALVAAGVAIDIVERIKLRYVGALLAAGEIRLTQGEGRAAAASAAAALAESPFDEAAHRLALAAAVQLRDRDLVRAAVRRLDDALAEVAVDPAPTTAMLRHHASRWLPAVS